MASRSTHEEWESYGGRGVSEIEEEVSKNNVNAYEVGSIGEEGGGRWSLEENAVYVAVWREVEEALSMDALIWTIDNAFLDRSSALVFLVHVFPETKYIPTPLGKLPINQVNPEQKEKFLADERSKRRDLLQKFLNVCSVSQVKVDTVLIESDMEGKAILDLIPILNITKLVLGANKTTVRRMRSKKGNGAADLIVQKAPEFCEVKIICEGKEMSELTTMESPSPSPSPSPRPTDHSTPKLAQNQDQTRSDSIACGCFKI
ncbi:hypothetical protein C2S51_036849 [Perilla frutescens var. frutescens]|nr:hypothetical protein C2S51_036849 [Perilla frutescens var. frutescens]